LTSSDAIYNEARRRGSLVGHAEYDPAMREHDQRIAIRLSDVGVLVAHAADRLPQRRQVQHSRFDVPLRRQLGKPLLLVPKRIVRAGNPVMSAREHT
jgi:hypothetical protein